MNPIENILNNYPVMILDGAMATELEKYNCDLNDALWSAKVLMENPELIKKVHLDYFHAGADIALTASYQATVEGFMKRNLTKEAAKNLIIQSVTLAAEARDEYWAATIDKANRPKPLVAASVGPYGAYLADGSEFTGNYKVTKEALVQFHEERIAILLDAGADILICETIPCLMEAEAILSILKRYSNIYAIMSFSAKDEQHISNGEKIADCAKLLDPATQVAAIGINCTNPEYIVGLITEIKQQSAKPIAVYPNSGETYHPEDKTWSSETTATDFGTLSKAWYQAGAKIIGGCCRTSPRDIEKITNWARK